MEIHIAHVTYTKVGNYQWTHWDSHGSFDCKAMSRHFFDWPLGSVRGLCIFRAGAGAVADAGADSSNGASTTTTQRCWAKCNCNMFHREIVAPNVTGSFGLKGAKHLKHKSKLSFKRWESDIRYFESFKWPLGLHNDRLIFLRKTQHLKFCLFIQNFKFQKVHILKKNRLKNTTRNLLASPKVKKENEFIFHLKMGG